MYFRSIGHAAGHASHTSGTAALFGREGRRSCRLNFTSLTKSSDKPCLVTYNPITPIDEAKIVLRHWFQHIVHDVRHVALLVHLFRFIQGKRRSWHCGAHT